MIYKGITIPIVLTELCKIEIAKHNGISVRMLEHIPRCPWGFLKWCKLHSCKVQESGKRLNNSKHMSKYICLQKHTYPAVAFGNKLQRLLGEICSSWWRRESKCQAAKNLGMWKTSFTRNGGSVAMKVDRLGRVVLDRQSRVVEICGDIRAI